MRLANLVHREQPDVGAVLLAHGHVTLSDLAAAAGRAWPATLDALLAAGALPELQAWLAAHPQRAAELPAAGPDRRPGPPLRRPPKILGVGLNYAEHAGDLGEERPDEPATFMKPATTIVGPGDAVRLPPQSARTTGEAELGLVMGRRARHLDEEVALAAVAGVVPIIDMTAEDILQRNPRFLTRAKSFDTFLAFGPHLVTLDEVGVVDGRGPPDGRGPAVGPGVLDALEVRTVLDDEVRRRNVVANMRFSPARLVAFFSQVMTLEPGDVIATGTPGAVVLSHGATVGCAIPGVGTIACPVVDEKRLG